MPLTRTEIIQREILSEKQKYSERPEGFREKYIEELVGKYGPTQRQFIVDTIYKELRSPGEPAYVAPYGTTYGTEKVKRYDKTGEYYEGLDRTPPTGEEKGEIFETERERIQSYIDSINQMYTGLVTQEEKAGEERLGKTRAIMSFAGLLGGPRGGAQMEKTREGTQEQVKLLQQEKVVKIEMLLDKADQRALDEIKAKREEAKGNQQAYIDYLADVKTDAREDVKTMAQSGISLERLKESQNDDGESYYEALLRDTGSDELQFDLLYESNLPKPQQSDFTEIQYEKDGNIWLKKIAFDPATGVKTEYNYDLGLPYSGKIKYETEILDDGTVLLVPETLDPDESLDSQIKRYGAVGQFAKPVEGEAPVSDDVATQLEMFLHGNVGWTSIPTSKGMREAVKREYEILISNPVIKEVEMWKQMKSNLKTQPDEYKNLERYKVLPVTREDLATWIKQKLPQYDQGTIQEIIYYLVPDVWEERIMQRWRASGTNINIIDVSEGNG